MSKAKIIGLSQNDKSDVLGEYRSIIASKAVRAVAGGLKSIPDLHPAMKSHQAHSTAFALEQGRAMLALDTGLGKSLCALDWGRVIVEKTNKPVMMFAPMAVAAQHEREAVKWGIDAKAIREPHEITTPRIYVTNYDRHHKFDPDMFGGVILDESSILKSFSGQMSKALRSQWGDIPFRVCCTATPAPNDHTELGMHSEFLGWMSQTEMLTRWFLHDSMDTGTWRMKGHAVQDFWSWVASWARCVSKPSDLGFDNSGYDLPPLETFQHIVAADRSINAGQDRDGQALLFRMPDTSATAIHGEKRLTIDARAGAIADVVRSEPNEPWIVWVDTDYEADAIMAMLPEAVEVRGSMKPEYKEETLEAFSRGDIRILVTKPRIAGYGLNWQHCARMAFVGLSFSYEAYYQAIRRCYRFGQVRPVHVHVAMADTERAIFDVVSRKAGDHDAMKREMTKAMAGAMQRVARQQPYEPKMEARLPAWI